MSEIDIGDHVFHMPSGEHWVVAYVRGDRIAWCGWPPGEAYLVDCTLLRKATKDERDELLYAMAAMLSNDERAENARAVLLRQEDNHGPH